jgi:hypothetical protein
MNQRSVRAMVMGAGSMSVVAAGPVLGQMIDNGPLSTGPLTASGVPAPPGTTWSELQVTAACANAALGFSAARLGPATGFRVADDFTITDPAGTLVTRICIYEYLPGASPMAPMVSAGTLRIWAGRPGDPGSTVIFGDTTTDRLLSQMFYQTYRIPSTTTPPPGQAPTLNLPIFKIELEIDPTGLLLAPGTYWLDWDTTAPGNANHFATPLTVSGQRALAGWNARQLNVATGIWTDLIDLGDPGACADLTMDLKWQVKYILPLPCPPNCDGSTTPPVLNVLDFICFQTKFAQGDPAANCDGSTQPPILNVLDFICFQTSYAQGCP